jgi:uncharacterized protein
MKSQELMPPIRIGGCCVIQRARLTILAGAILIAGAGAAEIPKPALEPVCLRHGELAGEMGRRLEATMHRNFLALDFDRDFLRPFQQRRAAEAVAARFGDNAIELGETLDAAVNFARYAGGGPVTERKNALIRETLKLQSPNGYIGVFLDEPQGRQMFRNYSFEEASFLVLALAEEYRSGGGRACLDGAQKLADYMMDQSRHRSQGVKFSSLSAARAFFALYRVTGDRKYLTFAADEPGGGLLLEPTPLRLWQQDIYPDRPLDYERVRTPRVLPQGLYPEIGVPMNPVDRCHVYTLVERALMQMHLNRIEPAESLMEMPRRLLGRLTDPQRPGMVITGACGWRESWSEDQDGRGPLGETCATVHLLWFLDQWLRDTGDLRFGDLMERILYNTFFAAQEPEGRRLRYFTAFSGPRRYFEMDTYCCPGNFRRGMSLLPCMAYYRTGNGIAINLWTPSRVKIELPGGVAVALEQETGYPSSGEIDIRVSPSKPARFPVFLRLPRWCKSPAVTVNGQTAGRPEAGARAFVIEREWHAGDKIAVRLPMEWRWVKGTGRQTGRAALMRGPVVFCLGRRRNPGMQDLGLRDLTIDNGSLGAPSRDDSVRPGGISVRVQAWKPDAPARDRAPLALDLAEFPDPAGEEVYFRLRQPSLATTDELLGPIR